MLVLFVTGVMDLVLIAAIAVFILLENGSVLSSCALSIPWTTNGQRSAESAERAERADGAEERMPLLLRKPLK